jgi:hypothetical protein
VSAEEFHRRIDLLSRANDDDFQVVFRWERGRWLVSVYEPADRHEFVSGQGDSPEQAMHEAWSCVAEQCKDWGYSMPKGLR